MKFRITIYFLLFPFLTSIAQLRRIEVTKIEINYYAQQKEVVYDTVAIDFLKLNSKDTLTIFATIRDCGEFGGHTERIKIFKKNNILYAQQSSEPLCDLGFKKKLQKSKFARKGKYTVNRAVKLNNAKLELVKNYIIKFNEFKRNGTTYSNAPTDFWINLNNKTLAKRHDKIGKWKEFIDLREKLYD